MRLKIGRLDYHHFRNGGFGSQTIRHPSEDTFVAPPLPLTVEGLRRAVLLGRIALPKLIAIGKDYAAQYTPVIDARLTVALGKEGLRTVHLRSGQPKKGCS